MSPSSARAPIVGLLKDLVPQDGKVPGITTTVHHQNRESGGHTVGLSVAEHQPGVACRPHNHRGGDEQFYVLSGYGIITVDGQEHHVQTGESVFVPAGAMHQVAAVPEYDDEGNRISSQPFRVLCSLTVAPGHEDDPAPWAPTS